jgi:hypothetical protein
MSSTIIIIYYGISINIQKRRIIQTNGNGLGILIIFVYWLLVLELFRSVLVSGKVRHAQGQRLNRFEVRRKRESERTKGEVEMFTLFPKFPTPNF